MQRLRGTEKRERDFMRCSGIFLLGGAVCTGLCRPPGGLPSSSGERAFQKARGPWRRATLGGRAGCGGGPGADRGHGRAARSEGNGRAHSAQNRGSHRGLLSTRSNPEKTKPTNPRVPPCVAATGSGPGPACAQPAGGGADGSRAGGQEHLDRGPTGLSRCWTGAPELPREEAEL